MSPYRKKNFKIKSPALGDIYIQPEQIQDEEDQQSVDLLLLLAPLSKAELSAAEDFLSSSQLMAFCPSSELPALDKRGYAPYRFHRLGDFEELNFERGKISFFPAKMPDAPAVGKLRCFFKGLFSTSYDAMAFHAIVEGQGEEKVLFLSTPLITEVEWTLIKKIISSDGIVVGSNHYRPAEWEKLSKRLGIEILFQDHQAVIKPKLLCEKRSEAETKKIKQQTPMKEALAKGAVAAHGV